MHVFVQQYKFKQNDLKRKKGHQAQIIFLESKGGNLNS